ncbi:replication-relaxation family protein [Aneurinibacillus tyrosinisolvens]|uniref:replication-relaxation family protein n=1 Tax=Aneurinibacillus tyrosinisolvens TaxID=1443435 RepID=UPI000A84154E|nr:replication-relaxation family protein [Aneurinibacillus tyrosinisolvens]
MSLDRFSFLTRRHIQQLHRLGGDRNAQKVLQQMEQYLHTFKEGYDTVHYLNKLGREMIGSEKQVKRTLQAKHILMRNDFFFFVGCPITWKNEVKTTDGKVTIKTDAMFTRNKQHNFVEIDNTQTMSENRVKMDRYKQLFENGAFQKQFGYFPTLHIVTVNKSRMKRFKDMCEGMPVEVYLVNDIK